MKRWSVQIIHVYGAGVPGETQDEKNRYMLRLGVLPWRVVSEHEHKEDAEKALDALKASGEGSATLFEDMRGDAS